MSWMVPWIPDSTYEADTEERVVDDIEPLFGGNIATIGKEVRHGALQMSLIVSVSTIEGGGDTTIPSPGRSPKHPLPGIGLHDSLHGRA